MQRYRIDLAYNGKTYFGWQVQPNDISVQEAIESCLTKLHSNNPIKVVGCGRTDTGVHAAHYVLHTDMPSIEDEDQFIFKLNRMLPPSIVFHSIKPVDSEFHARFHATARTYRYFIHRNKKVFGEDQSWHVSKDLDFESMNKACSHLLGKQDFTSLSKLHTDVKTNICRVDDAQWSQIDENSWFFEITADRFLRNMVRATVGTLVDVGLGKIQPDEIPSILEAKDRGAASTSVPAHGLFLWKIEYPG